MEFSKFYKTLTKQEKTSLAEKIGTTPAYLYQISGGFRKPGAPLAKRLHKATGVPLEKLRPDIWDAA